MIRPAIWRLANIVLTRSADIEMRSEDLYVSEKEIRVRYSFFNTSKADIRTLVAFPIPDLPALRTTNTPCPAMIRLIS